MQKIATNRLFKQLFLIVLCLNFLSGGALNIAAQTRRAAPQTSNQPNKSAPKCSGAWTGNVTYTRTQAMSDNKTVKRVSTRGEDKRDWEMRYNYKASVAVLETPERNGSNVGKARIEHRFSSIDKTTAREENSCDRGKTWQGHDRRFPDENRNFSQGDRR